MNTWHRLAQHVDEQRSGATLTNVQSSLLRRLRRAADLGVCDRAVQGWFTTEADQLTLSNAAPAGPSRRPAIPLHNLEHLVDGAYLTLGVTFDRSRRRVEEYSIQLRGSRRIPCSTPWYARVDLDRVARGIGPCSHAVLHTHVGTTPENDDVPSDGGERKRFSTRVPTPWLSPADALDWLLAVADRRFEPAQPEPR